MYRIIIKPDSNMFFLLINAINDNVYIHRKVRNSQKVLLAKKRREYGTIVNIKLASYFLRMFMCYATLLTCKNLIVFRGKTMYLSSLCVKPIEKEKRESQR